MRAKKNRAFPVALAFLSLSCAAVWARAAEEPQGAWLRRPHAEAFIQVSPNLRVRQFQRPGRPSLLAEAPSPEIGLRVAVMEPEQNPLSYEVTQASAAVVEEGESFVLARTEVAPQSKLSLDLRAELDAAEPVLRLTYRLTNHGDAERTLSIWSLVALPRKGVGVVAAGDRPRPLRRLVLPFWSAVPNAGFHLGRNSVLLDFDAPLTGNAFKAGVVNELGEVAAVREGEAILMHSPFVPGATYPEGGANITLFQLGGERAWAEIEQVGPLTAVPPGGALERVETLRLFAVTPPVQPTPDAWLKAVQDGRSSAERPSGSP